MCTTVASAARRPAVLSPASRDKISAVSFQWFIPPPSGGDNDTPWGRPVQERGGSLLFEVSVDVDDQVHGASTHDEGLQRQVPAVVRCQGQNRIVRQGPTAREVDHAGDR